VRPVRVNHSDRSREHLRENKQTSRRTASPEVLMKPRRIISMAQKFSQWVPTKEEVGVVKEFYGQLTPRWLKKQESEDRKLAITDVFGPKVQERTRPAARHPLGGDVVRVVTRGTKVMSFRPKTCTPESKVIGKNKIE
jgi:hypothetical protein